MIDAKRQIKTETMIDYYLDVYERSKKTTHKIYAVQMIKFHLGMADQPSFDVYGALK
tara:strand:+ start:805 stop:975 length:171 start_codon:yes stop_codon:yes gene_type:complete